MRKYSLTSMLVAALALVAATSVQAQTTGPSNHPARSGAAFSPPHERCEGLLCLLTPNAMATPLTVSQAREIKPLLHLRDSQHTKHTKIVLRAGTRLSEAAPTPVADGHREQRVAIFSLFDPVVVPGDYGRWLRRVPRDGAPQQAVGPTFAKNQPT